MQDSIHSINALFDQLGLPSTDAAIDQFIADHNPLPLPLKLHEAEFWSESQAELLKQLKAEDADWAMYVDELDARLRTSTQ